jgi:hypothetical protein
VFFFIGAQSAQIALAENTVENIQTANNSINSTNINIAMILMIVFLVIYLIALIAMGMLLASDYFKITILGTEFTIKSIGIGSIVVAFLLTLTSILGMLLLVKPSKIQTAVQSAKIDSNSLQEQVTALSLPVVNKTFLENNIQSVSASCQKLANELNNNLSVISNFLTTMKLIFPGVLNIQMNAGVASSADINTINENFQAINMTNFIAAILGILSSTNGTLDTYNAYVAQNLNKKNSLIASAKKLRGSVTNLNHVIQMTNNIKTHLLNLNYNTLTNLKDILSYLEGLFSMFYSPDNKTVTEIISYYKEHVGGEITSLQDLTKIVNAFYQIVGPNQNFVNLNYEDKTQKFNTTDLFKDYIAFKVGKDSDFKQKINNIKAVFLDKTNGGTGLTSDFLTITNFTTDELKIELSTMLDQIFVTLTDVATFNLKYNVTHARNTQIIDLCNQALNNMTQMNEIRTAWGVSNSDLVIQNIQNAANLMSLMRSKFSTTNLDSCIQTIINLVNKVKTLKDHQGSYGLTYTSVNFSNFDTFLSDVQESYLDMLTSLRIIVPTTTFSDSMTKLTALLDKIIAMPQPDNIFITSSKATFVAYLQELREGILNLHTQFLAQLDKLGSYTTGFITPTSSLSSTFYNTALPLNTFLIPLSFIDVTDNSLINSLETAYNTNNSVSVLVRYFNNQTQLIPSMSINGVLANFDATRVNIASAILALKSKIFASTEMSVELMNNYNKLLNAALAASTTIPAIKFLYYFLFIARNTNNQPVGLLVNNYLSMTDLMWIINNIPSALADPDIGTY